MDKNLRYADDVYYNHEFGRYTLEVIKDIIKDYKFDIEPNEQNYDEMAENNDRITTFFRPLHFQMYLNRQQRRYKINANFMEQLMKFYETHYGATFRRCNGGYEYNINKLYQLTLEQIIKERADRRLALEQEQYAKNFGVGGITDLFKPT